MPKKKLWIKSVSEHAWRLKVCVGMESGLKWKNIILI